jgi:hypothetical protein
MIAYTSRVARLSCRTCLPAWKQFLTYVGFTSNKLVVLEDAHRVCAKHASKNKCVSPSSGSKTPVSKPPALPPFKTPPPPKPPVKRPPAKPTVKEPPVRKAPVAPKPAPPLSLPTNVPAAILAKTEVQHLGSCVPHKNAKCAAQLAQCSGEGFKGASQCCGTTFVCVRKHLYYAQCRNIEYLKMKHPGWSGEIVHCT